MRQVLIIPGRLTSLNEYTKELAYNRFAGRSCKRSNQNWINICIRKDRLVACRKPVNISIRWYERNERRDPDNVEFAVKFILDSLRETGIIPNDTRQYIRHIAHDVYTDRKNPRIEVELKEIEDD